MYYFTRHVFTSPKFDWANNYLENRSHRITYILRNKLDNEFWALYSNILVDFANSEKLLLRIKLIRNNSVVVFQVWENKTTASNFENLAYSNGSPIQELINEGFKVEVESGEIQDTEVKDEIRKSLHVPHILQFVAKKYRLPSMILGDPLKSGLGNLPYPFKQKKINETWGLEIHFDCPSDFFKVTSEDWQKLIYKKNLLIFKNMQFSKEDYVRFGQCFGHIWSKENYSYSLDETEPGSIDDSHSIISQIKNLTSKSIKMSNLPWHADIPLYKGHEYPIRSLWMKNAPNSKNSGVTGFLKIDEESFKYLSSKKMELIRRGELRFQSCHRPGTELATLPMIKTHTVTKTKSLQFNYFKTESSKNPWIIDVVLDGKPQYSCRFIEECLHSLLEQKELQYFHIWEPDDIVVYDNFSFLHNHTVLDEKFLYRINIDHNLGLKI